jgi:hypothetical protein
VEESGTMSAIVDLNHVRPWRHLVAETCALTGEDPYHFAAMGCRESGWGEYLVPKGDPCGTGDNGHGHGLFQIDDRYHRDFVGSARFRIPKEQALYACQILRDARAWFVRSPSFRFDDKELLERAVYAAYNAGPGHVYHSIVIVGPSQVDEATTGRNYSADIFARATALRELAPDLFGIESEPLAAAPVPPAKVVA